ncbi:hypothetical protein A2454_01460 [Candidatus Peribacteria bacterium RIFOXYC2_FULL_55_14]|nr:MAG: hypothetical protein UY85_C0076G0004 [Candidatus Peribacteria bacterium GW2011_GWB1_54_5]OGJ72846.1 MAG: hypothetical protein A2198_00575 [Candidatus Peribacteria bacterium RIFOXYA1_FULL_56_14]OGJ73393.1 MAG: hypothetical protein A2217_01640 [Candidatus Peribacteria bacterium RIFOXYA2_FULL_55_28]OGJ74575.1 MAG: hypothetical protein A2384_02930 [Candidatus Peribacteria bacterium RIFOXYB1_FULL_54_35]OGJ77621.1 MAG: hypothetical protein A2327_05280 [Candidatus Peribacteria bacterium RIFOXY
MTVAEGPQFEAAKALLERRLVPRALQYLVHTGEADRNVLSACGITEHTVRGLLAQQQVPIGQIVEEAMLACLADAELGTDEDPWEYVDPRMREEKNPLLAHVRSAVVQCTAAACPGE